MLEVDIVNLATAQTMAFIERYLQIRAERQKLNCPGARLSSDSASEIGKNSEIGKKNAAELLMPCPPLRLLEVGSGRGHLAQALAGRGLSVRAVDLHEDAVRAARACGVDCLQADFLAYDDQPFDVLLFARSLHHISPLELAMERAAALLRDDGLLFVEDFGAERADEVGVAWLGQKKSAALSAGLGENPNRHEEATSGSLQRWRYGYFEKHKIADSQAMLKAAERIFACVQTEAAPYLYRYLLDIVRADAAGLAFVQSALEEEKVLIAQNEIAAVGWRLIASKTAWI